MTPDPYPPTFDDELLPTDTLNQVVPGLWIGDGDVEPQDAFEDGFQVMITLVGYERHAVAPPPGAVYLHWPIQDSLEELPDELTLAMVVDLVQRSVRDGRPTLVACAAGLNRSGMVVALALQRLGHTAEEAIATLREVRGPYALCNGLFEGRVLAGP